MNNLEIISAWITWARVHDCFPGDTHPTTSNEIVGSYPVSPYLHVFAETGDGSLLVIWSNECTFEQGPVLLIGAEGGVCLLGGSVAEALAIVAAAGDDVLDSAIEHGFDDGPNQALADWLYEQYDVGIPMDVSAALRACQETHSAALQFVEAAHVAA